MPSLRLIIAVQFNVPLQSADWMAREIATPFELHFGKLRGLTSMKSMSSASRCLVELGYAGNPSAEALLEAQSVSRATWRALSISIPEPFVLMRGTQLS
jgi:multidrug efflux pump subunit AcrB